MCLVRVTEERIPLAVPIHILLSVSISPGLIPFPPSFFSIPVNVITAYSEKLAERQRESQLVEVQEPSIFISRSALNPSLPSSVGEHVRISERKLFGLLFPTWKSIAGKGCLPNFCSICRFDSFVKVGILSLLAFLSLPISSSIIEWYAPLE